MSGRGSHLIRPSFHNRTNRVDLDRLRRSRTQKKQNGAAGGMTTRGLQLLAPRSPESPVPPKLTTQSLGKSNTQTPSLKGGVDHFAQRREPSAMVGSLSSAKKRTPYLSLSRMAVVLLGPRPTGKGPRDSVRCACVAKQPHCREILRRPTQSAKALNPTQFRQHGVDMRAWLFWATIALIFLGFG